MSVWKVTIGKLAVEMAVEKKPETNGNYHWKNIVRVYATYEMILFIGGFSGFFTRSCLRIIHFNQIVLRSFFRICFSYDLVPSRKLIFQY